MTGPSSVVWFQSLLMWRSNWGMPRHDAQGFHLRAESASILRYALSALCSKGWMPGTCFVIMYGKWK